MNRNAITWSPCDRTRHRRHQRTRRVDNPPEAFMVILEPEE